jgi:hypothetical protein
MSSIEAVNLVMSDQAAIVRRVKEAAGRMQAEMEKSKSAVADNTRLIADSKEVVARATKVVPPLLG